MYELRPDNLTTGIRRAVTGLLDSLPYPQVPLAILSGNALGRIFVDNPDSPALIVVSETKANIFIAGSHTVATAALLDRLFCEVIVPESEAMSRPMRYVQYAPASWTDVVPHLLRQRPPIRDMRVLCHLDNPSTVAPASVPEGFSLRKVDMALLNSDYENVADLRSEILGQWDTLPDFCHRGVGFCLVCDGEITTWCLTEYHTESSCSIGVETIEKYRGRGHGTVSSKATIFECICRGLLPHWDAWKSNVPSVRLAERVGFRHMTEYPVYFFWNNRIDNLLVNANWAMQKQNQPQRSAALYCEALANTTGTEGSILLRTPRGVANQLCRAANAEKASGNLVSARGYLQRLAELPLGDDQLEALKALPEFQSLWPLLGN